MSREGLKRWCEHILARDGVYYAYNPRVLFGDNRDMGDEKRRVPSHWQFCPRCGFKTPYGKWPRRPSDRGQGLGKKSVKK